MPRTAAFLRPLDDAFPDEVCAITQEPASEIEGGVVRLHGKPYSTNALLGWKDRTDTHPLTRARLSIHDMHPVMTPHTRMADYAHTVRALAARGWNRPNEVYSDRYLRTFDHDYAGPHDPIQAMQEGQRGTLWWQFTQMNDPVAAARQLDETLALRALGEAGLNDPHQYVRCVLANRQRTWRFPPDVQPTPIYMEVNALFEGFARRFHEVARRDFGFMVVQIAEELGLQLAVDHEHELNLVLYPPTPAEWLMHIALPELGEGARRWWTLPHTLDDVVHRILMMQSRCRVNFRYEGASIHASMLRFMSRFPVELYSPPQPVGDGVFDVEPADQWLRNDLRTHAYPARIGTAEDHARMIQRLHGDACPYELNQLVHAIARVYRPRGWWDALCLSEAQYASIRAEPTLLPDGDPYQTERLLPALQYGLERMEAEARVGA